MSDTNSVNLPSRIVVMRYRFIGDTLLTIPFLRQLRQHYPKAVIHLLVGEDAHALMAHCPYIDEAIVFEPRKLGFWQAIKTIRNQSYDTAYVLKRSFSSALMARLANIPRRIGFDTEHRGFLLTHKVPYEPDKHHEAVCFLQHLPDFNPQDLNLETWLLPETEQQIIQLLKPHTGPRIVLHATSTNAAKCWPISHFATLAQQLIQHHHAQLYFLGTPSDVPTYQNLLSHLSSETQKAVVNLCGQTSVTQSTALLKHMDLVIANDSGMIHMAAATHTPVVALFGPMDPHQWEPLLDTATIITHPNMACRPCRMQISCNHQYPCLTELSPEMVFHACKPYLTS